MAYDPCQKCDPDGLKILPVGYAVLPSPVANHLPAGISGKKVISEGLSGEHHYGLRILREGYLYVIYDKGPAGVNYAEAYRINRDATFEPMPVPWPLITLPKPACKRTGHALRTQTITIKKPEQCGEVFIAFSESLWSDATLRFYLNKSKKHDAERRARMQSIFPSTWITGTKNEHALEATQTNIESVVEYAPKFRPRDLEPNEFVVRNISNLDGTFDHDKLKLEHTRYPVTQRYGQAKELAAFMKGHTAKSSDGKPCPPMLLALWDGIGITHELAGFRNDAGSMLALYVQERALQIDALESIRGARAAKLSSAGSDVDKAQDASRATERMRLRGQYMQMHPELMFPTSDAQRTATRAQANAYADQNMPLYEKQAAPNFARYKQRSIASAQHDWDDNYLPSLAPEKLKPGGTKNFETFAKNFEAFQETVADLQGARTADLDKWLKAPLFLATLRDYHEDNVDDGKAFAAVIAEAVNGLPSEAKGAAVMDRLVNMMDPTQDASIVWRAFAYNQKEPKEEIKELLKQATAHKATVMEAVGEYAETVNKGLEKLKTFVEFVEKMGEVKEHEHPVSATERFLKGAHGDRLILTMGTPLFKWTGLGKAGDCVGALMIRGALMLRVGITQQDTQSLIKWAAKVEPSMRLKLQNGYLALRAQGVPAAQAYVRTVQSLAADADGKLYRAKWNSIKIGGGELGEQTAMGVRLGGTLAIIELLSFGCNLAKADKTSEDYAMLVAGGFSSISACLIASTKLMTSFAQDGAATLANLKAVTGYFGGVSAAIGVYFDAGKAIGSAKDGKYALMVLYTVKSLLGLGGALASFLTALSASAPLIARVSGGKGVAWLGKAGAGIEGAEKSAAAAAEKAIGTAARKAAQVAAEDVVMEEAGVVITERAALLVIGRAVLFLGGWEIAVVITLIQILIWIFSDNDLQTCLKQCVFGIHAKHDWTPPKQHEAFEKALQSMGLTASEGSE